MKNTMISIYGFHSKKNPQNGPSAILQNLARLLKLIRKGIICLAKLLIQSFFLYFKRKTGLVRIFFQSENFGLVLY